MTLAHGLREQIRSGAVAPCSHGEQCSCVQRQTWERAVNEIYRFERETEQPGARGQRVLRRSIERCL